MVDFYNYICKIPALQAHNPMQEDNMVQAMISILDSTAFQKHDIKIDYTGGNTYPYRNLLFERTKKLQTAAALQQGLPIDCTSQPG